MAIRVELIKEEKEQNKRIHAQRVDGVLSRELGEAVAEMLPVLLEMGTPLNTISTLLWGKEC